ncbi:multidrug transporter [halophilic archaeon]|nr:multidrug transporter [halophilic archaeon]
MALHRDSSTIGTVIGFLVMIIAIAGTVFLDWTWSNPDGQILPLAIGVIAAVGGGLITLQRIRS